MLPETGGAKSARKRSKDCSDEEMKRLMHLGQVRRREAVKAKVREGKVSISHGAAKCRPVCLFRCRESVPRWASAVAPARVAALLARVMATGCSQ